MKNDTNTFLFCVAEGSDSRGWQAICLDLDIAVQGETLDEVRSALNSAVRSYVIDVLALKDGRDKYRLLNRRAPLLLRLNYAARLAWQSLNAHRRDGGMRESFEIPCHA